MKKNTSNIKSTKTTRNKIAIISCFLVTTIIACNVNASPINANNSAQPQQAEEYTKHDQTNSKYNSSAIAADNTTIPSNKSATNSGVTSDIICDSNSPCNIIQNTSEKVLKAVNKGLSSSQTLPLIQTVILPQFDFTLMTKYAMGLNWKQASFKQQGQLVDLFRQLLVFTYSNALYKFKGGYVNIAEQKIIDKKASVITTVVLPNSANSQPIKVEYNLAKTGGDSTWKVYDIKIENASLVTTYRNQFNDIIQNNKIEGLISQLKAKVSLLEKSKE